MYSERSFEFLFKLVERRDPRWLIKFLRRSATSWFERFPLVPRDGYLIDLFSSWSCFWNCLVSCFFFNCSVGLKLSLHQVESDFSAYAMSVVLQLNQIYSLTVTHFHIKTYILYQAYIILLLHISIFITVSLLTVNLYREKTSNQKVHIFLKLEITIYLVKYFCSYIAFPLLWSSSDLFSFSPN